MFKKILFVLLICLLWTGEASAFSISPLKYVVTMAPQSNEELEINIKNDQLVSQKYNLKVFGAKQNSQGKIIFAGDISPAEDWIKPEKNVVQVGPNEEVTVKFFIKTTYLSVPGSYFLGLAAESISSDEQKVGLSGQLVCLLLLQVSGQVQESLSSTSWQTEKVTVNKIWNFDLSFKNNGVVELPIQSELIIRNWHNKIVYQESSDLGLLLPQADRIFQKEVNLNSQTLFSGRYSATLQLIYGRTGQLKVLTTNFWRISPIWIITLSLIAVGLLIVLYRIKTKLAFKLKTYIDSQQK